MDKAMSKQMHDHSKHHRAFVIGVILNAAFVAVEATYEISGGLAGAAGGRGPQPG